MQQILTIAVELIQAIELSDEVIYKVVKNILKRHLLCVFLSAAIYDPLETLKFLTTSNILKSVLTELFTLT